jgi:4-hydroxybenzoate-CoA ligase
MHTHFDKADAGRATSYNAVTWLLDRNVELGRGDKIAFIDSTNKVSYRELQANSCRVASLLTRLGVRREERVAIIAIDTVEFPAIFLGTMRAGAIPVPLNTLLTPDQYQYVLEDSRAKVLFISEALYNPIRDVLTQVQTLSEIVVIGGSSTGCRRSYAQEIADEPTVFVTVRTHRDEPAFWLYSSGSTGRPKGTRHVHSSLAATAETYGAKVLGITENDTVLSAAKFYFAYGLGNAMTFPMSVGATTILNEERATPDVFLILFGCTARLFSSACRHSSRRCWLRKL